MSVVEELVAESLAVPVPSAMRRELRLHFMPRKADVLVGMRRCGKTFAMFDAIQQLLADGVERERILYLNLDDDRFGTPDAATLSDALDAFQRVSPLDPTRRPYLFLDEIQVVPGWERFARRVIDTDAGHLVLGGSSSKMLSSDVATVFRGRGLTTEVLPYGLREFTRARGVELPEHLAFSSIPTIQALADEYLKVGGFPEIVDAPALVRPQLLQSYVESVVIRDVVERHGIEAVRTLRHLIFAAFSANAGPFSVSALEGSLRSQGHRTSKVTLMKFLDHLVDAYLFFLVPIDSRSEKVRIVNPRKVYAADHGLASAMYAGGAANRGALLENAVYLELRRRLGPFATPAIAYHRTDSGRVIDFVVDAPLAEGRRDFYQVCWSLEDTRAMERETTALAEAMVSHPGSTATLVTRLDEGEVQTGSGVAKVVPFWKWALQTGDRALAS